MEPNSETRHGSRQGEQGYVLLTLLLTVALIIILAAAIVPTIKFQIERDREEELIHRGVQYARAIRSYYKKFGRYPTKIEDLENTNQLRFLRKRYKDPITGKDFKLLHFGEVKLTFSGGIGGGTIPGANAIGGNSGLSGGLTGSSGFGQTSTFGGNSGLGTNSSSSFGQNQSGQNPQTTGSDEATGSSTAGTPDASESGDTGSSSHDQLAGVTFGGGPIVGVVSASKKTGYREFNHKKKYSEWQFIYDPGTDRGGLLMGPNQPAIQAFQQQGVQNVNGQSNSSGFGTGNTLGGSPSGIQNNPNSPSGGFGGSNQPSNPPQQQ